MPARAITFTQISFPNTGIILGTTPIYLDFSESIGGNQLAIGSQVHYWMELHRNALLRQQIADAKLRVLRFFIRWEASTAGYPGEYGPCQRWDETTETGTWDWSLFDSTVTAVYEGGAIPLICLNIGSGATFKAPTGMWTDPDIGVPSPESFSAYCSTVAEHCERNGWNSIIWEIFNEAFVKWNFWPFDSIYTDQNRDKWERLTAVFNAGSQAIHEVFPNAKVGETSTQYKGWSEWIAENGIGQDFVGHHMYACGNAPEEWASDQALFDRAINGQGVNSGHPELRWVYEDVFNIFAQNGKYPDYCITETALNHDWNPQDYRKFSELGAAWYATELMDYAKRGIGLSIFYNVASNEDAGGPVGFGMVELWGDHTPRYPYFVNQLIGNSLDVGDALVHSSSSNPDILTLAWKHGNEGRILIVQRAQVSNTLAVDFNGAYEEGGVSIQTIDSALEGIQTRNEADGSNLTIALNGYSVCLVTFPLKLTLV